MTRRELLAALLAVPLAATLPRRVQTFVWWEKFGSEPWTFRTSNTLASIPLDADNVLIDTVAMWDRALTDGEIRAIQGDGCVTSHHRDIASIYFLDEAVTP